MKQSLLTLLLFIITSIVFSQKKDLFGFSKYENGTVFFRDGSHVKGLVKITGGNKIKFKKNKDSKKAIYNEKNIRKLILEDNSKYVYRLLEKFDLDIPTEKVVILVKIKEIGNITTYTKLVETTYGNDIQMLRGFVGKKNSININEVPYNLRSKEAKYILAKIGSDCPGFLEKTKDTKSFKLNFNLSFAKAIEYYNNNCGNLNNNKELNTNN